MTFQAPDIDYVLLLPVLVVLGAATIGVLAEAVLPRGKRFVPQVAITVLGLGGALAATINVLTRLEVGSDEPKAGFFTAVESIAVDGPTAFSWLLILVLGLLGVMLFADRKLEGGVTAFAGQAAALPGTEAERQASAKGLEHTEVFPLLLFAVSGMMVFPAANDLLTLFVALEVMSLPLYLLCGLARRRRLLSQEAALKYFLLGAFSSGFFVYGLALTYGYAGSMQYARIADAVAAGAGDHALLLGGMGLLAVGLFFKVGVVPFHSWTPDVYQGAPTAVTAFMAAATKVAAFVALLRLFYVAFGAARWDWMPIFWVIAILTMVIGSVLALAQTDMKRMLAYSSIAHAGFILVGVLGVRSATEGGAAISPLAAVLFYVTTYGFMAIAAFALVTLVRDSGGEATHLSRWAGLGKESPVVAGVFAFLLLGMAGIPLTSGFTGKWAVFAAAFANGAWPLVIVAVLCSVVAIAFYLRIIVVIYFGEPAAEGPSVAVASPLTASVIAVGTAATLLLGVVPGPLLDALGRVAQFIR